MTDGTEREAAVDPEVTAEACGRCSMSTVVGAVSED